MSGPQPGDDQGISRRALLWGGGAGALAVGAGLGGWALGTAQTVDATGVTATAVPVTGIHQAGVGRPALPQQHCLVAVADLATGDLRATLAALGATIAELTAADGGQHAELPDGPGDLSVTVGLGPTALAATGWTELAGTLDLPVFSGDEVLPAAHRGGDLLLSVNASDPVVLEPVLARLTAGVPGYAPRWSELGFRGAAVDGVARNPFGYHDGIIRPETEAELDADVWIGDGPLAGGTVCVIRRFRLDVAGFRTLAPARRDAVIGREQRTGAPLSGGARDDDIDLDAKTDAGDLLVPPHAHARAAHPSYTGSRLMLRRSYSYRAGASDHGHLFISYQNDVQTFARTQLRLDDMDDLMAFATPTATAAFAVLPGFTESAPLGDSLFG